MTITLKDLTGVEFPLFAFSHCRDVVAAVSRAGGFGVLGGTSFTPESLETELRWIDEHVEGKPYGVDLLVPEKLATTRGATVADIVSQVPREHREFAAQLLRRHGIDVDVEQVVHHHVPGTVPESGEALMEVAFRHPIRLIASALGVAPKTMIEQGKKHGVPVAALVGSSDHALKQLKAGVDILVAQGTEAGGHCGEISTLVLVPEVLQAIRSVRQVPVLAAGGIMTGRQMAACMTMGASGAWTGSVWLATTESETSPAFRQKMVEARSSDTVRSRARTGKPCRQLRSAWHDAWDGPGSPGPLPMPLMSVISKAVFPLIERASENGNESARELLSYYVGQGVGMVTDVRSARSVVQDFKEDFADALVSIADYANG